MVLLFTLLFGLRWFKCFIVDHIASLLFEQGSHIHFRQGLLLWITGVLAVPWVETWWFVLDVRVIWSLLRFKRIGLFLRLVIWVHCRRWKLESNMRVLVCIGVEVSVTWEHFLMLVSWVPFNPIYWALVDWDEHLDIFWISGAGEERVVIQVGCYSFSLDNLSRFGALNYLFAFIWLLLYDNGLWAFMNFDLISSWLLLGCGCLGRSSWYSFLLGSNWWMELQSLRRLFHLHSLLCHSPRLPWWQALRSLQLLFVVVLA